MLAPMRSGCPGRRLSGRRCPIQSEFPARRGYTDRRMQRVSGGVYSSVKSEIVAEVVLTDFQAEQSSGKVSWAMLMKFCEDGWSRIGMREEPP